MDIYLLYTMIVMCLLIIINISVLLRDREISVNNVKCLTQANDDLRARNKILQERVAKATQSLEEVRSKVVAGMLYTSNEQIILQQEDVDLFLKIKLSKEDNSNG